MDYYNLEMTLAIGYQVRSQRGIEFRRWASTTLKEYLVKGFVLDTQRLKDPVFYAVTHNKMLHAVTGHTAAELITARANATCPTWDLRHGSFRAHAKSTLPQPELSCRSR